MFVERLSDENDESLQDNFSIQSPKCNPAVRQS